MSPAELSWLQTFVGAVLGGVIVAVIIKVCVWCWGKCCINRDAEGVPNNADMRQNLKMKRLCCIDASLYSRAEEGRSNLLHGDTIRSESVPQGPEGSPIDASLYSRAEEGRSNLLHGDTIRSESVPPQGPEGSPIDASLYSRAEEEGRSNLLHGDTIRSESVPQGPEGSPLTEQEQDKDSTGQGAVEPNHLEAVGRPRSIGRSVHEFELQDLQGQNDIKLEGSLEEVQDPDGSSGTQLEQDGQSGQEVLPFATNDEHSEGLRQRSWVAPLLELRSWVATRLRLRYWVAPQPLATQLGD